MPSIAKKTPLSALAIGRPATLRKRYPVIPKYKGKGFAVTHKGKHQKRDVDAGWVAEPMEAIQAAQAVTTQRNCDIMFSKRCERPGLITGIMKLSR